MAELALILLAAALVNNLVLVQALGVCPLFGSSGRVELAVGTALVTGLVLSLAAAMAQLVEHYLLVPLGLEYLQLIAFVLAVGAAVRGADLVTRRFAPLLAQLLGAQLPLVTANCAVLGVALLNSAASRSLIASRFYAVGAALGFGLVLVLFAGLRERLAQADVPLPFRGTAIAFVTAGILSLAFMGFAGFARL
jgi:electron transport complex protein RnfA